MNTTAGRNVFEFAYNLYKLKFEAGPVIILKNYIKPNSYVIDVGANIGFFTQRFGNWVSHSGKVIAFEPEKLNFESLRKTVLKNRLDTKIILYKGVAAEKDGTLLLELNPFHPGDHRIGTDGVETQAFQLDTILEKEGWPLVSLVKIDVQGAEERVLQGAKETIRRMRPNLFVEVDDVALRTYGSSAQNLLSYISSAGYSLHVLKKNEISIALNVDEALFCLSKKNTYLDFLCLPKPTTLPEN